VITLLRGRGASESSIGLVGPRVSSRFEDGFASCASGGGVRSRKEVTKVATGGVTPSDAADAIGPFLASC